jgi:hypothetical protein
MGSQSQKIQTEDCLFYIRECAPVQEKLDNSTTTTTKTLNVLGVIFDSRLKWTEHVANAIAESNCLLNVLKLNQKYFNTKES